MSDLLRRRFRDKLPPRPNAMPQQPDVPGDEGLSVPADSLRVIELAYAPQSDAGMLNSRFAANQPLIRLTVALGSEVAARTRPLNGEERGRLLALCPYLPLHGCGAEGGVLDLLSPLAGPQSTAGEPESAGDGMTTAHLIEHVALDLAATAGGGKPLAGASCSHADDPTRFDVFLQCEDPDLGRAMALLAVAAVRDLGSETDRTIIHTRSASLLADLITARRTHVVPEDVADRRGWTIEQARDALEELVRLDFLEPIRAPLTFSTAGDLLFRRCHS